VIAALVLTLAVAQADVSSRDALIERWVAADPKRHHASVLDAPAASGQAPPANLQRLVQDELGVPGRYRLGTAPPPAKPEKSWWERALQWIVDRVGELWRRTVLRNPVTRSGAVATFNALAVIAALLVLFVGWRLFAEVRFRRHARGKIESLDAARPAGEWFALATASAARGDYATASRLLFAATIAALDSAGHVRVHRSATVGEVRRALRSSNASLATPFDAIASAFTTGTYAERPVRGDEWERAADAYRNFDRTGP
jgi:hypothetical protein